MDLYYFWLLLSCCVSLVAIVLALCCFNLFWQGLEKYVFVVLYKARSICEFLSLPTFYDNACMCSLMFVVAYIDTLVSE